MEDGLYEAALAEFQTAELNELEYIRYSAITAPVYDNLRSIYRLIADTQEKSWTFRRAGRRTQSLDARSRNRRRDHDNSDNPIARDPDNQKILLRLLLARLDVLGAQIDKKRSMKDKRLYDPVVATAREMVANADSLMRSDRQNMILLAILGFSKFTLAKVLLEGDDDWNGWKEAIQGGRIHLEKAESAAEKNVKDKGSLTIAGKARAFLADSLDVYHKAEDAHKERLLAFKDYNLALSRYPANTRRLIPLTQDTSKLDTLDRKDKKDIVDAILDLKTKIGKETHAK